MKNKKSLALAQITLLILGIIAVGWALGSETGIVAAAKVTSTPNPTNLEKVESFDVMDDFCKKNPRSLLCPTSDPSSSYYQNPETNTQQKTQTTGDGKESALSFVGQPGIVGQLSEGVAWAVAVWTVIQVGAGLFGLDDKQKSSVSSALTAGIIAGKGAYGAIQSFAKGWGDAKFITDSSSEMGKLFGGATQGQVAGVAVGVVVAVAILYMTYKKESTETVIFICEPWQAPAGGNTCEECNKQGILPCSEYQCKSLGQSCELINKGTTEEQCVWVNRKDVTAPIMTLWKDVLTKEHVYTPDTTVSPPDIGTRIKYSKVSDGCIKAFTPLSFGIITDEPASCKLDYERKDSFEEMSHYFGGTPAFVYNHTQIMSLPGASSVLAENISIKSGGEFSLFVRCKDSNGNVNVGSFVFRFCVDKGPDTTPPLIVTTNLLNKMPIAYNKTNVDFEVYTNEPATCRWSHLDQSYDKMEQNMTCSQSILEMNAQMVYRCKTVLDGIKNGIENNFYIRCEDQPLREESGRNRNMESYKFTLIGTRPLVVDYVRPNGTIKDSTERIKVTLEAKTSAGYKEGEAICSYSPDGTSNSYVQFFNTNSYVHSQELLLPQGNYQYYIRCVDLGGNADNKTTSFKVETDVSGPLVVRAYNEESNLKIVTDESAECVYGLVDCNYEIKDGIKMSSIDTNKTQHYTSWDSSKTFYIKCQDKYTNQPYPNQCSIILRPEYQYNDW